MAGAVDCGADHLLHDGLEADVVRVQDLGSALPEKESDRHALKSPRFSSTDSHFTKKGLCIVREMLDGRVVVCSVLSFYICLASTSRRKSDGNRKNSTKIQWKVTSIK